MLSGTKEFQANIRYIERQGMHRYETPLWANSFVSAVLNAEMILLSEHPSATVLAIEIIDLDRQREYKPRLVVNNPNVPPKKKV